MGKKLIFIVFVMLFSLYFLYDRFSYKVVAEENPVRYRDIGSYARYDMSFWNEKFDNFMSYSIISENLNRAKTRKLKWNEDSDEAYICTVSNKDCAWNKLPLEKKEILKSLKNAIKYYELESVEADLMMLGGEMLSIELFDKKEQLFYALKIDCFPQSAENAKKIFELLESVISD